MRCSRGRARFRPGPRHAHCGRRRRYGRRRPGRRDRARGDAASTPPAPPRCWRAAPTGSWRMAAPRPADDALGHARAVEPAGLHRRWRTGPALVPRPVLTVPSAPEQVSSSPRETCTSDDGAGGAHVRPAPTGCSSRRTWAGASARLTPGLARGLGRFLVGAHPGSLLSGHPGKRGLRVRLLPQHPARH